MIKLFVTDIDGCLAQPYTPYDLDGLGVLRRYVHDAGPVGADDEAPAVSICSGRPLPYVEAMTQALGLTTPVLFEAGGGRFDPGTAQTTWSPALTDERAAEIETVQHWFVTECIPDTKLSLDHAKRTQAGVVSPDRDEIVETRARTEEFVEAHALDLHVFSTDISVDVVPPGITKRDGLEWLTGHLGVGMSDVAYIGDSDSDLEALRAVGLSFAPTNADEVVLEAVDHVTGGSVLDGTVEAYRHCLQQNRA